MSRFSKEKKKIKSRLRIVSTILFVILVTWFCPAANSASPYGRYIIYTADDAAVRQAAIQTVSTNDGVILKQLAKARGLVAAIPVEAVGLVKNVPGVLAVEPDVVLTAAIRQSGSSQLSETSAQAAQQLSWSADRIDAELAWKRSASGSGVGIAIIDTGIDNDHVDLSGNLVGGINFVGTGSYWKQVVNPAGWDDDNGHGTCVAGIAAAANNKTGIVGVAPKASLWAVKVLDRNGSGYLSDVIDGILWCVNRSDIWVINLSMGINKEQLEQYPANLKLFRDAVDDANNAGIVVVASAGDNGNIDGFGDNVTYPARFDSVIAVGATDASDERAWFSSTGPSVELAAPGVNIVSTSNDGSYKKDLSGTSLAASHVAGTAALVFAGDTNLKNEDVRLLLQESADKLGSRHEYGFGLVDAEESVTDVQTNP